MNLHADIRTRPPAPVSRIAMGLLLAFGGIAMAAGQQQTLEDEGTEQGHTQIDQMNLANPEGELVAPEAPKETSPFFRDSKWSAQARSFYFDRDKYDGSVSEAWAVGGSVTSMNAQSPSFGFCNEFVLSCASRNVRNFTRRPYFSTA